MEQVIDTTRPNDDTRARILAAARELLALKGTRGTTTREVAERAGVNEATLFRHFGTKQNMLIEMRSCYLDSSAIERMVSSPTGDARHDLRELGRVLMSHLQDKADLIRVSIAEEQLDPEAAQISWKQPQCIHDLIVTLIERYISTGELHGDAAWLTKFFMGIFFAQVIGARRIWRSDRPSNAEIVDFCVDIFLNGARGAR